MKQVFRIKSKILRTLLKVLGLTGLLFVMEACYGAPSYYYLQKDEISPANDSLNINKDQSKFEINSGEDE